MTPLGKLVRELRTAQGLTLEQTAARAQEKGYNLTLRAVQAVETGDSLVPQPDTLRGIAAGLGVDVSVLAVKVYEPPPEVKAPV